MNVRFAVKTVCLHFLLDGARVSFQGCRRVRNRVCQSELLLSTMKDIVSFVMFLSTLENFGTR